MDKTDSVLSQLSVRKRNWHKTVFSNKVLIIIKISYSDIKKALDVAIQIVKTLSAYRCIFINF